MFGKDPGKFYPSQFVKIGRFNDEEEPLFHEEVEGNLLKILEEVPRMLDHKFLKRNIRFEGFQRIEVWEYPIEALREMLLNALAHRIYQGAHIQLRVYEHHLSLWNEGPLPMDISAESLKGPHVSHPRNLLIAGVLFRAGYIDMWGTAR